MDLFLYLFADNIKRAVRGSEYSCLMAHDDYDCYYLFTVLISINFEKKNLKKTAKESGRDRARQFMKRKRIPHRIQFFPFTVLKLYYPSSSPFSSSCVSVWMFSILFSLVIIIHTNECALCACMWAPKLKQICVMKMKMGKMFV